MMMELPKILLASLTAGVFTQIFKFIRASWRGTVQWHMLNRYGGMPSAHTAFVASLTTAIGISEGITSPVFAVTFILSAIIVRDAIGFRRYLGTHGRILNMLVRELPQSEVLKFPGRLDEKVGHTPLEAFIGALIGITISCLYYIFFF